jgi:hypothetical protein
MVQPKKLDSAIYSGMPPWHTILMLGLITAFSTAFLPSMADLDGSVAVPETFSRRLFPQYLSLWWLVVLRTTVAVFIFALTAHHVKVAFSGEPTRIVTPYLEKSKLRRGSPIELRGFFSQAPFTLWAWNLLGVSFAVNAYLAYAVLTNQSVSPRLLRAGVMLFEMAAPLTLLVAAVVKYAIWPQALKQRGDTTVLKSFRALAFHNANVIFAVAEVTLGGGLPVRFTDASLAAIFGSLYVLFTWYIAHRWNPASGPQYLYFFLDTSLGPTSTLILLVLYIVFVAFYVLFCGLHQLVDHVGDDNLPAHILSLVLVSVLVCRVRD